MYEKILTYESSVQVENFVVSAINKKKIYIDMCGLRSTRPSMAEI